MLWACSGGTDISEEPSLNWSSEERAPNTLMRPKKDAVIEAYTKEHDFDA